uniref:Putative secreted protein n=1 Tax=Ixodes ricinus TaxID=34613 RepID=A0A090XB97_IXORI
MDAAIRIIWFTLEIFLVTSGVYGVQQEPMIDDYFKEVMSKFYSIIDLVVPDNISVTMENVEIFLDDSETPTTLPKFSLGKFSGLGTKFHHKKKCHVMLKKRDFSVACTIEFIDLQATLPTIDTQVTYVLLINGTVTVFFSWPKPNDPRPVKVNLITLSNVTFAMKTIKLVPSALESTSTYSLEENSPTNFKRKYKLVLQQFITEGAFKHSLEAALKSVGKPKFTNNRGKHKKAKGQSCAQSSKPYT